MPSGTNTARIATVHPIESRYGCSLGNEPDGNGLVEPPEHPEVLAAREVLVDRGVLTGEPDQPPHLVRLPADVQPADARRAGVGVEQGREDPHRRRLARAVRAEQSEDASLAHFEIDAVERAHLGLARPVDLDEPLCLDRCQVGKPTPPLAGHTVR